MILLDDAERRKFALWLRQDVESNRLLVVQLGLLNIGQVAMVKERQIAACLVVAEMLDTTESQTIG